MSSKAPWAGFFDSFCAPIKCARVFIGLSNGITPREVFTFVLHVWGVTEVGNFHGLFAGFFLHWSTGEK
jgi:hypothetical protein